MGMTSRSNTDLHIILYSGAMLLIDCFLIYRYFPISSKDTKQYKYFSCFFLKSSTFKSCDLLK